jgi:hypothetical protein
MTPGMQPMSMDGVERATTIPVAGPGLIMADTFSKDPSGFEHCRRKRILAAAYHVIFIAKNPEAENRPLFYYLLLN